MLMMSLVLHGAVLMLPIPSDLDKPKPPKKQEQVKITQLPRTRSSPKLSPQSSSKPNPQSTPEPSQSTRSNEATPPDFLPELTTQLSPQLSESTRLNEQTLPESSGKPNPQPSPEPSESTPPEPKQQSANPLISQANPEQNPTSQPNKDADQLQTAQQKEMTNILQTISVASSKELPSDIKSKLGDGNYITLGIFPEKTPKQLGEDFRNGLSNKGYEVSKAISLGEGGFFYGVKKDIFTGQIQLIPILDGTGTAIILLDKLSP